MKKLYPLLTASFLLLFIHSCDLDSFSPTDPAGEILGNWTCREESQIFTPTPYTVNITRPNPDEQTVRMNNLYQLGTSFYITATLNGRNIVIPKQTVDGNDIEGSGEISLDYNQIELYYSVDDKSGEIDQVSAILTR